jgi:hypothetical protein
MKKDVVDSKVKDHPIGTVCLEPLGYCIIFGQPNCTKHGSALLKTCLSSKLAGYHAF